MCVCVGGWRKEEDVTGKLNKKGMVKGEGGGGRKEIRLGGRPTFTGFSAIPVVPTGIAYPFYCGKVGWWFCSFLQRSGGVQTKP